jgi:hypothetical protein
VHHVVDADTGEVLTTPLDRPLAPLSRAERLARLGHRIDLPSPWGPVYRLTPRNPYQAAPLNWVTFYDAAITLPEAQDEVYWSLRRTSIAPPTCPGCAPISTSRRSSAASSPSPSRRPPGPERWGTSRSRDRPAA